MLPLLGRRLVALVPVLVGISLLVFVFTALAIEGPGPVAAGLRGEPASAADIRREYRLDEPLWVQYGVWMGRMVRGDLGRSLAQPRPVTEILVERLPVTLRLALVAAALAVVLGLVAGTVAAVTHGGATEFVVMTGALVGVSMPVFWLALMLILVFAVWLSWLPVSGYGDGSWRHLLLPALALGALQAGQIARAVRGGFLEAVREDNNRTARAKGLTGRAILLKHALRNAVLPVIGAAGIGLADLLAGAPLTETVFGWPGLGRLLVTAVGQRDAPVVGAALLLFALVSVVGGLLADLVHGAADPRLRT